MKNCRCNVLEATNIRVTPNVLCVITIIPTQQFKDHKCYELCLCQALPPRTGTEPVFISDGATTYYCLDHAGDIARCGKLRGHKRYRLIYGSDGNGSGVLHFNFLCSTVHEFKEKLREDIKDEMKATIEFNSSGNYKRVLLLLKVADKLCETKPFLLEEHTDAPAAVTRAGAAPT